MSYADPVDVIEAAGFDPAECGPHTDLPGRLIARVASAIAHGTQAAFTKDPKDPIPKVAAHVDFELDRLVAEQIAAEIFADHRIHYLVRPNPLTCAHLNLDRVETPSGTFAEIGCKRCLASVGVPAAAPNALALARHAMTGSRQDVQAHRISLELRLAAQLGDKSTVKLYSPDETGGPPVLSVWRETKY